MDLLSLDPSEREERVLGFYINQIFNLMQK